MATLNDKPVRLLTQEMITSMTLKPGQRFTREQAVFLRLILAASKKAWHEGHGTLASHMARAMRPRFSFDRASTNRSAASVSPLNAVGHDAR